MTQRHARADPGRGVDPERRLAPRHPGLAVQLGVCGHRHLPGADPDAIAAAATGLLQALGREAALLHAADQAQTSPLYSAAPPRLRCICGLAEGADSILAEAALDEGWELVAVLPFAPDEFAADFAGAALGRYRALLARATEVCALDGDRDTDTAYVSVGEIVVEQSDVLLAVWDGKPARGPGGTEDVVRLCRERRLPVAVVPASGDAALVWLDGCDGETAAILKAALLPPAADAAMARTYFADALRNPVWARSALRSYERIVTAGIRTPSPPPTPQPAPNPASLALDPAFLPADRLATEYAARYRAAGLLRYGLILPATFASLLGWYGSGWLQPAGNLANFAILLFVLRFSARGWWGPAHRRFIAYRALAEYLRSARTLAAMSAVPQPPGSAAHHAPPTDWTAWYCRAAIREQGLAPAQYDPATVEAARATVRAEALGQVGFLLGRATRFDDIARRLRQIGVALFLCGMTFSAIRAVLLLASAGSSALREFNAIALVLPAMAPIFLGLLSFNEYGKLATRYRAVAAELRELLALLDSAAPRRQAVLAVARRIAEVMLAEGADWQQLIRARTVSAY